MCQEQRKILCELRLMKYDKTRTVFSKEMTEAFIDEAMLNDEEIFILKSRINNMPVTEMARELNLSRATVHRYIQKIKIKYDTIQSRYPDRFPQRKKSACEDWMDAN